MYYSFTQHTHIHCTVHVLARVICLYTCDVCVCVSVRTCTIQKCLTQYVCCWACIYGKPVFPSGIHNVFDPCSLRGKQGVWIKDVRKPCSSNTFDRRAQLPNQLIKSILRFRELDLSHTGFTPSLTAAFRGSFWVHLVDSTSRILTQLTGSHYNFL